MADYIHITRPINLRAYVAIPAGDTGLLVVRVLIQRNKTRRQMRMRCMCVKSGRQTSNDADSFFSRSCSRRRLPDARTGKDSVSPNVHYRHLSLLLRSKTFAYVWQTRRGPLWRADVLVTSTDHVLTPTRGCPPTGKTSAAGVGLVPVTSSPQTGSAESPAAYPDVRVAGTTSVPPPARDLARRTAILHHFRFRLATWSSDGRSRETGACPWVKGCTSARIWRSLERAGGPVCRRRQGVTPSRVDRLSDCVFAGGAAYTPAHRPVQSARQSIRPISRRLNRRRRAVILLSHRRRESRG